MQPKLNAPAKRPRTSRDCRNQASYLAAIVLRYKRLGRDQPPRALDEIRQRTRIHARETHENPRIVPIMIGDVKDLAVRLQQNLTIQQIRAKDQTLPPLMQTR